MADFAAGQDPARERGWIATGPDGDRVGCILCVADAADAGTAVLRVLLVDPRARGAGVGARLLDTATAFARERGYGRVRLWTNDPLVAAGRLYRSRGFRLTAEARHRSFGADLVGQTYELTLR